MPRFRPRISILNALLLTTIVAMAIVIVQYWREIGPLRAEVRNLRQQVGVLTIDDPSLVQAIKVPTDVEDVLKWRVYVPQGHTVWLRANCGDIFREDFPRSLFRERLGTGEQVITVTAKNSKSVTMPLDAETMSVAVKFRGQGSSSVISVGGIFGDFSKGFQRDSVSSQTVVMGGSGKLVLCRTRYEQPGVSLASEAPLPGFIIWLEGQ